MPKNTAAIGKREEREIVKSLEKIGYKARRQPGSGNRAVDLQHDVIWLDPPCGHRVSVECKFRTEQTKEDGSKKARSGIANLLSWMDGANILTVRASRGPRYAFLEWDLLLALVGEAATRDDLSALEGIEDSGLLVCPNCDGEGTIWPVTNRGINDPCEQCNGSGRIAPPIPFRYKNEKGRVVTGPDQRGGVEQWRRDRIQAAHQNPPKRRWPKGRKLQSRPMRPNGDGK